MPFSGSPKNVDHGDKFMLECTRCGTEIAPALVYRCPDCSGVLEPRYRAGAEGVVPHEEVPEQGYFPLLPLVGRGSLDDGVSIRTPCRLAPELGAAVGVPKLWLKDESRQPTGTTKDRLAALVLAVYREFGVSEFVTASTGNTSTALARAVVRDPGMRARFFCGHDFVANHDLPANDRVSLTVVPGTYAKASAEARRYAADTGLHLDAGFFNWARREGLKLAYLEAVDQMGRFPDVVVQAVSSGMGMLAAYKGFTEHTRVDAPAKLPRFLMAQEETCAPMARAWRDGRREITAEYLVENPVGLATAILLGDAGPYYPYLREIAAETGGAIVAVHRDELIEARRMLAELEGTDVCFAAAAAVAAVRAQAAAGLIGPEETVLVNLTGRSR